VAVDASARAVNAFFDRVTVAGLLLPDGWFGGRPMENQHRLTFVAERPKRLLIELDEQVLLSFSGRPDVNVITTDHAMARGTPTLEISRFRQCVIEYLEYGNDAPHSRSFLDGRVLLVSPLSPR
jgi:hypothetical protein